MKEFSNRKLLDARAVNTLLNNYDDIFPYFDEKQTLAREYYEKQFASFH